MNSENEQLKKGEQLFGERKFEDALQVFQQICSKFPRNVEALNNAGVTLQKLGKTEQAISTLEKALKEDSSNENSFYNLLDCFINENRLQEASNVYNRYSNSIALSPTKKEYERTIRGLSKKTPERSEEVGKKKKTTTSMCENSQPKRIYNILFVQEAPCIRNYKMAKALRSRGHRVSLGYVKARLSQMYKDLSDEVYNECIHLKTYRILWDISKNYDIIHCHNEPDTLTVAAMAGRTPVVHDTHDLISLRANQDRNLTYFEGVANRGADGRIYTTRYQQDEAQKLYGVEGPSIVFYNYASQTDLPKKFLPKLSQKDGKTHIVYEGGIGGNTHRDFASLFIELARKDIHIHIYPTFFNKQTATVFEDYPSIHYNEPLSPKQIMQEMTQYDIGIIPFNIEKGNKRFLDSTIANKLFEYMAAGLPVAASPLQSYVDYFKTNPVGITFQSGQDIISNLELLKDISKRTDLNKYVFTYENKIQSLENHYDEIINNKCKSAGIFPGVDVPVAAESADDAINKSFKELSAWVLNNGWDGYDPYDIQDYLIQCVRKKTPVSKEKQRDILQMSAVDPVGVRKQLGIKKKRNAKGMGLLISSWVRQSLLFNEQQYLHEAEKAAEWLLKNSSSGYEHLCWGYPFDWQSVIFIPKDTPSAVVSTVVGDGLWQIYTTTRNAKYLDACISICKFITENLACDDMGEKGICFSYTPIDNYHVHNANLFCGEFLARIGKEIDQSEWKELGKRTANYALSEQNSDGSIYYWGNVQDHYAPKKLDHYHTGFEIRSLFGLAQALQDQRIKKGYEKYLCFYLNNYILADGTPKITPKTIYPVDIHGAAESVLLLSTLTPEYLDLYPVAKNILHWTISKMQTEEGWFIHQLMPKQEIRIPYLRWGQGWMLRAFTEYFTANKIVNRDWGYYSWVNNSPGKKANEISENSLSEMMRLRELAIAYGKLNNGKIPSVVFQQIQKQLGVSLTADEIEKDVLSNLPKEASWQSFVEQKLQDSTSKKTLEPIKGPTGNKEESYQLSMPDTKGLVYGSREWAEKLFNSSKTDPWGHDWRASQKIRYQVALSMIKQNISLNDTQKVLDIGCALGDFTNQLSQTINGKYILGVDISETAVNKCTKKYPHLHFERAQLPELNVSSSVFDLIVALEVIYYVDEKHLDSALEKIASLLSPNGWLLISTYLYRPPFETPEIFKRWVGKRFEVEEEKLRYHKHYTEYETIIRNAIDSASRMGQVFSSASMVADQFVQMGGRLLSNLELIEQFNQYSKNQLGEKSLSHSLILARKKQGVCL